MTAHEVVYFSNKRCDHENDIEQLNLKPEVSFQNQATEIMRYIDGKLIYEWDSFERMDEREKQRKGTLPGFQVSINSNMSDHFN